jgi:hypothetical protein
MSFHPYNRPLKIQKSIKTLTPKMKVHLGMWGFNPTHSPTLPGFTLAPHLRKPFPWS